MGDYSNDSLQIQAVKGGFIVTTLAAGHAEIEVFVSSGKALKTVRSFLEVYAPKKETSDSAE